MKLLRTSADLTEEDVKTLSKPRWQTTCLIRSQWVWEARVVEARYQAFAGASEGLDASMVGHEAIQGHRSNSKQCGSSCSSVSVFMVQGCAGMLCLFAELHC